MHQLAFLRAFIRFICGLNAVYAVCAYNDFMYLRLCRLYIHVGHTLTLFLYCTMYRGLRFVTHLIKYYLAHPAAA